MGGRSSFSKAGGDTGNMRSTKATLSIKARRHRSGSSSVGPGTVFCTDAPKEEGCWEECCALAVLHVSRLCVPGLSGHEAELLTEAKSQVG